MVLQNCGPFTSQIVALMSQPDFFCRRDTIRRWKGQPLHKVDAMHSSTSPKTSPQSNGCEVWMWARQDNERQLAVLDVGKGTFRRAAMTLPGGRARATAVVHHGDSIRVWVSTVVSVRLHWRRGEHLGMHWEVKEEGITWVCIFGGQGRGDHLGMHWEARGSSGYAL